MFETERLILVPLTLADTDNQFAILSDPEVSRPVGIFSQPFTRKQAQEWCAYAEKAHSQRAGLLCGIFERATKRKKDAPAIGYVGTADTNPARGKDVWEVGYWIKKEHWGKGYTSEGLRAVMNAAVSNFGVLGFFAELAQTNIKSARVVEKCGFVCAGEFLKNTPLDPQRPSYLYRKDLV